MRDTRKFLPLLDLFEDEVPSSAGSGATSKVFLFPLPSILDRILRSPKTMAQLEQNAAGHILRGQEALDSCVAESHVFLVHTRGVGDRKECNTNDDLARGCGLYTMDGVKGSSSEKLFPGDVLTCVGVGGKESEDVLCRVLELFFDEDANAVRLTLRRLRKDKELSDVSSYGTSYRGLDCVWEEVGEDSRLTVTPQRLGALCTVLTPQEADNEPAKDLDGRGRRTVFVGISFCEKRPGGSAGQQQSMVETHRPWRIKSGAPGEQFVDMRVPRMNHNDDNLPYASMPMVWYFDKFNAMGMSNKVRRSPCGTPSFHLHRGIPLYIPYASDAS